MKRGVEKKKRLEHVGARRRRCDSERIRKLSGIALISPHDGLVSGVANMMLLLNDIIHHTSGDLQRTLAFPTKQRRGTVASLIQACS